MNFDEYMTRGATREDKLVTIFNVKPELLTPDYYGIISALFNNKILREQLKPALPDLDTAVYNWESKTIQKSLLAEGANFIDNNLEVVS